MEYNSPTAAMENYVFDKEIINRIDSAIIVIAIVTLSIVVQIVSKCAEK